MRKERKDEYDNTFQIYILQITNYLSTFTASKVEWVH